MIGFKVHAGQAGKGEAYRLYQHDGWDSWALI